MLTNLSIKNFALIDQLEVSFTDQLTIITGETGAGKSIILGGLGLILGKRADLSVINDTSVKCIVEAEFAIQNYKLNELFKLHEIEYDDSTIIRREILPSGKSRAFVNDSPVSLQVLKSISEQLIDIHSQHQTLQLTDDSFQFEIIDALADNYKILNKYTEALTEYKNYKKSLEVAIANQKAAADSHEYNVHVLNELLEAKLDSVNQDELEQELEQLNNVESIQEQLMQANQLCADEQLGALSILSNLKNSLRNIEGFSEAYESLFKRIESVQIELEDVFVEIENEQQVIEANPERLEIVTSILNRLQALLQKHNVTTVEDLLLLQNELESKVAAVENSDELIREKQQLVDKQYLAVKKIATDISENRKKALPKLTQQLEKILVNLGMENAKFNIAVSSTDDFLYNGTDHLSFLFSANKGGSFNELKKAASGGELSRIMLAIKAILSKYKQLPTIMFDEIDTGVSGDVANKMGMLMQYMSENMQVFSITHLPQIASKGNAHFKVYKEDVNGVTKSNLKPLTKEERIQEIAEMIGGKQLTDTALNHAKELLNA